MNKLHQIQYYDLKNLAKEGNPDKLELYFNENQNIDPNIIKDLIFEAIINSNSYGDYDHESCINFLLKK